MKIAFAFLLSILLCGCAAGPTKVSVKVMTRQQEIAAINDCRQAHLKPKISYIDVQTPDGILNVPVDVQCVPFTE